MAEKRLERIRRNPKGVRPEELDSVLRRAGFVSEQPGTSHKVYRKGATTLSVPQHRPHIKEVYVKRAIALLEAEGAEG